MFFEKEKFSFPILEVLELKQKKIHLFNTGRNFSALSFRFRADTYLKTKKNEYHVKDHFVSYVPARLDYRRISDVDELIVIHLDPSDYDTGEMEVFLPKDPEPLSRLFREILHVWNEKGAGYQYRCTAILYEILAECYRQNDRPEPQDTVIQKSVDYLLKNYKKKDLYIGEIAEQSFISEVYFRKLFKKEYGISPQKYIAKLRIQNAMGLISSGYYSLKEIADLSGYHDYKHFSVAFKKSVGVSPSEYFYHYQE